MGLGLFAFVSAALALAPASLRALQVGDCSTALADPAGATQDAERLALARCELRRGAAPAALKRLDTVNDPGLRAYAQLLRGEAQLEAGQAAAAGLTLQAVTLPGGPGERARMLRGRALVEAGQPEAARELLSGLLNGRIGQAGAIADPWGADGAEVRWWLAEGALRRGERAKAEMVWSTIWARNPTSPRAAEAATRLQQGGQTFPDPKSETGRALIKERIETLDKLRLSVEALALRDLLGTATPGVMARATFSAKAYPRSLGYFAQIQSPTMQQRFDYALATSRAGDYAAAAQRYEAVIAAEPGHKLADFASFKLGYLAYDKAELDRAIGLFRDHLGRYPNSEHADEARWFIAWSLVRLERWPEALSALAEVTARHPQSGLAVGARYWRGRVLGRTGDAAGERAALQSVMDRSPTSSYAWFAAHRLGRKVSGQPLPEPPPTPVSLSTPAFTRGAALARVGLDAWARAELDEVGRSGRSKAEILALGPVLVEAGDFIGARNLANSLCGSPGGSGDRAAQMLCWPRPVSGLVVGRARAAGLNPNLPFGIMMAESALKPWVSSIVGARGLMQLMPEVARPLHTQLYPGEPFSPDAMFQPGYNAALGTAELIRLSQRFSKTGMSTPLPAIIAAYNGGPEAVERWLAGYPTPPEPDRFAEDISFTETRQYVRNVLGYLQTWRLVYGDED